ncbi:hypothetical protein SprV_0200693100 [Sparganum proliferum]
MLARVMANEADSEEFAVTNGVGQGCALVPTLFTIMSYAILLEDRRKERSGYIHYRTDGKLLNIRRLKPSARGFKASVYDLLFVDDRALNTTAEENTQRTVDLWASGCYNFELVISTEITSCTNCIQVRTTLNPYQ